MAEIQLPGLETVEKLWNWASNQASIFPEVWANPRSYFQKFGDNENPLPAAVSFLSNSTSIHPMVEKSL
jgi:hypothetical protein